jgi:hypothetical protein
MFLRNFFEGLPDGCKKTAFVIVTAVKTSNLATIRKTWW